MLFSGNFWANVILFVVGIVILAAIYFTGRWNYIVGSIVLGIGLFWLLQLIDEAHSDSDPAGNAMAAGFATLAYIAVSIVAAIAYLLFMKFSSNTDKVMLVSMIVLGVLFVAQYIFWVLSDNEP